MTEDTLSPASNDSHTKLTLSPDSDTSSVSSSLRRPHRPPDLDLRSLNLTPIQNKDITIHSYSGPPPAAVEQTLRSSSSLGKADELKGKPLPPGGEQSSQKRRETSVLSSIAAQSDIDPTRCSTPMTTKMSGSVSERVSLIPVSQKLCESLYMYLVCIEVWEYCLVVFFCCCYNIYYFLFSP